MYKLTNTGLYEIICIMNMDKPTPDDIRSFRYDSKHRYDAADMTSDDGVNELSKDELFGFVAGIDPRIAHDLARRSLDIDYPGTELDPDFEPPEHPYGQ